MAIRLVVLETHDIKSWNLMAWTYARILLMSIFPEDGFSDCMLWNYPARISENNETLTAVSSFRGSNIIRNGSIIIVIFIIFIRLFLRAKKASQSVRLLTIVSWTRDLKNYSLVIELDEIKCLCEHSEVSEKEQELQTIAYPLLSRRGQNIDHVSFLCVIETIIRKR